MCRIASIKSKEYKHPRDMMLAMLSMQKGHDNSGFAMVMQDLGGVFVDYKELPILSIACNDEGIRLTENFMRNKGFDIHFQWSPPTKKKSDLNIQLLEHYTYIVYDYPLTLRNANWEVKAELLTQTRLELRKELVKNNSGFVYSFWPDVLTLKEIGEPRDIGIYFNLWDENDKLVARNITAQCRQNTNYQIVRYAAHPFFIQGYTLCANGENTFFTKNKEFQTYLHPGYLGFESDSQCFLYTLHYMNYVLKWPLTYYKHVITPLPFDELNEREDKDVLLTIRQSLAHLEINGPNTVIGVIPDGTMFTCADSKKLRPTVVAKNDKIAMIASEICGINTVMKDRDLSKDMYLNERETIVIKNNLEVERWKQ